MHQRGTGYGGFTQSFLQVLNMKKTIIGTLIFCALLWGATTGNIQWTQLASAARHGIGTTGQSFTGSSSSGRLASFDGNGTLVDSGVDSSSVAGGATPLTAGTSVTMSGNNRYFVCTATCSVTVPLPTAGVTYCVRNDDNVAAQITLLALGGSGRYESTAHTGYGTAGTGTMVSAGSVNDSVCIVGRDTTHYLTMSFSGDAPWTVN